MSDWASPDERGEAPSVRPGAGAPSVVADIESEAPPLRPRTPTELVDDSFSFIRRNLRPVVSAAALFVVPFTVLGAFLQRNLLDGESVLDVATSSDPTIFNTDATGDSGDVLLTLVSLLGSSLGLVFVSVAVASMLAAERAGLPVEVGSALRAAGRAAPALVGSWILVHLLELVGFVALIVPFFVVMVGFATVAPVIAVERLGALAAMRRSWQLTRRRRGAVMGVIAITFVVENVLANALGLVPTVLSTIIGLDLGWILLGAGTAAVGLLTTPFVALATIELYFDLRIRTEALDIEMQLPGLFDEPAAA